MQRITFSVASILTLYYIYNYCFSSNSCNKSTNNLEKKNESSSIKLEPLISKSLINESKKNMQLVVYRPKHLIPFKNYNEWEII